MYDDISVPDCGRGKHLPIGADAQNHDRSDDHYQICVMSKRRGQIHTELSEIMKNLSKDKGLFFFSEQKKITLWLKKN